MEGTKLIHLKNDLGVNKSLIWSSYVNDGEHLPPDEHTERGFDNLKELLEKKTQRYTKEECYGLVNSILSSSDWCVIDNHPDFTGLEVHRAYKKLETQNEALEILETI